MVGVAAATGSTGKLAGAGSVLINRITNTIDAHISDTVDVDDVDAAIITGGSVTVEASDESSIVSVAGGVSYAGAGSAVGAAVSFNLISNRIDAYIDGTTVHATGGLSNIDVSATSDADVIAVAIGVGASAGTYGLGGSLTVNSIANTVDAHVSNSTQVQAGGDINLSAFETDTLFAVAGGFATATGGGSAAGAALAYNYIGGSFDSANPEVFDRDSGATDQITAYIDNAQVTAAGDLILAAGFKPSGSSSTSPASWTAATTSPRSYGIRRVAFTVTASRPPTMAAVTSSVPAPVSADVATEPS